MFGHDELRSLARAIDRLDRTTPPLHSQRVCELCERVARCAGWSRSDAERLGEAAAVHDTGKVCTPTEVLTSARSLNDDEWKLLCEHPRIGAQLAQLARMDAEQQRWIREHHERPDGMGYPSGVADCSEGAQLLQVCDTYDVIVHGRLYQPARSSSDALRELDELRGAQFTSWAVGALRAERARRR